MSEVTYRFDVVFGSVRLPEIIGYADDGDGWLRAVMSDRIEYDQNGKVVRREPCEGGVRIRFDDEPERPWWKFW